MVGIVVEAVGSISEAAKQKAAEEAAKNAPPDVRTANEIEAEIRTHLSQIEELLQKRQLAAKE